MKKSLFTLFLLVLMGSVVFAQVNVTFRVNMGAKVFNKLWDPAKDSVTVRGSFQTAAGDASDWGGFKFKMSLLQDTVYGVTATFPSNLIGTSYEYKYVIGPDSWEGASNRPFTVPTKDSVLAINWYNNDSTHNSKPVVTNTFNFSADISGILGTGVGYFDPTTDSLLVDGLDWDGYGTVVGGARRTIENPLTPGEYVTSVQVKGVLGDSCKWKYHAYGPNGFSNSGYETGGDRWLVFKADGSSIDLPTIVPAITPNQPALTKDVVILFECNLTKGVQNAKNDRVIPVDSIEFIGLKGGNAPLGSWGGSWLAADTVTPNPTMWAMNDKGLFGDKVAGDKIYSRSVTFPAATAGGAVEFKFGAMYQAASSDAGGTTPLDNEGKFGFNHLFKLTDNAPTHIAYYFGDFTTVDVKDVAAMDAKTYKLNQNYPNPFNPSTKISFSLPVDGNVVLKVYNVLGKEVATLINGFQKAGGKEVSFNASNLPSGMYIYTIKSGNFTSSKKMMLLK